MNDPSFPRGELITLIAVSLVIGVCAYRVAQFPPENDANDRKRHATSYESAKEALDRMKDWAIWLVGIQTGAMGLVGLSFKSNLDELQNLHLTCALLSMGFLAGSTFCFGWLLAAFPSVQQRLRHTSANIPCRLNDIYSISLFEAFWKWMNVQFAACCSHWLGIFGFLFFALFFVVGVIGKEKDKPATAISLNEFGKPLEIRFVPAVPVPTPPPTESKANRESAAAAVARPPITSPSVPLPPITEEKRK